MGGAGEKNDSLELFKAFMTKLVHEQSPWRRSKGINALGQPRGSNYEVQSSL